MVARALRADAQRNRDAIVAAARDVFGARGLGAPLEEVAARANVGTATLYRRFATKLDLVTEAFEPEARAYVEVVDRGLADPDPWHGFVTTVVSVCAMQAEHRALADLVTLTPPSENGDPGDTPHLGSSRIHELVARAQASGDLRADFTPQDVVLIFMSTAGVVHRTYAAAPDSWRRTVGFMLAGLRAGTPLEVASEPPSEKAIWAAMARF